jgi:hypothetical protein
VATTAQDDETRLGGRCLVEEALDENALANARLALDEHAGELRAARLELRREHGELVLAPDERLSPARDGDLVDAGEHRQDLLLVGALLRIDVEEVRAQPLEIRRHTRNERARRWRGEVLLEHEQLVPGDVAERRASSQRLEQEHANRVPVGRRADHFTARLFGRHVRDGADHGVVARARRLQLGDGAEVEQHRAAARLDEDVRGLHVAMHDAGCVERREPAREPDERDAQTIQLASRCRSAIRRMNRRRGDRAGGNVELRGLLGA